MRHTWKEFAADDVVAVGGYSEMAEAPRRPLDSGDDAVGGVQFPTN